MVPSAFWSALKVQLSVPVQSRSPLATGCGAIETSSEGLHGDKLTLPGGSGGSLVWWGQASEVGPSRGLGNTGRRGSEKAGKVG